MLARRRCLLLWGACAAGGNPGGRGPCCLEAGPCRDDRAASARGIHNRVARAPSHQRRVHPVAPCTQSGSSGDDVASCVVPMQPRPPLDGYGRCVNSAEQGFEVGRARGRSTTHAGHLSLGHPPSSTCTHTHTHTPLTPARHVLPCLTGTRPHCEARAHTPTRACITYRNQASACTQIIKRRRCST